MSEAPRFFADRVQRVDQGQGGSEELLAELSGEEAHHALRVLRLRPGDPVAVLDDSGFEYAGAIAALQEGQGRDRLTVRIVGATARHSRGEPGVHVTLIQALPKGDKMDVIVQKGTETGVSRFVPVVSERVVVEYTGEKSERRRARWQRIAHEAAKQSRRGRRPVVEGVVDLLEAVEASAKEAALFVLWEGSTAPIKSALQQLAGSERSRVSLVVGPEGGFSEREAHEMERRGGRLVSLGPRILRTETAGPVACALVLYELDAVEGG